MKRCSTGTPTSKGLLALLCALLICGAQPAAAQRTSPAIRFQRVPSTTTSIVLDRMAPAGPTDKFRDLKHISMLCATFHDVDTRTVTSVGFTFVTYDGVGNRIATQEFVRNVKLTTGALSAGASDLTGRIFRDNCMTLRTPRTEAMTVFYYIDNVTFDDGTAWSEAGLVFPDRAIPGTRFDASAAAAVPVAASPELAPLIVGADADCATASAIAIPPQLRTRTVVVNVDPGAAISDGLVHIGDTSICRGSGDARLDAAALALVKQTPVAVVRGAAMTLYFPVVNAAASCNDMPRILHRELVDAIEEDASSAAHPGEYVTIAHVDVRPDGVAANAETTRSSGRSEFDAAARASALASRYWPRITAGVPVTGSFDFGMRWVVADAPGGRRTRAAYGPRIDPPAPECVARPAS